MASTYTANAGFEKPAEGEQDGTWAATVNLTYDLIDTAINGVISITLADTGTSGIPNELPITNGAVSDGRNQFIVFADGGDLGGTAYVQLTPNTAEKVCYVRNSLSGSRDIILFQGTYNASNDYVLVNGTDAVVYFNGGGAGAVAADVFRKLAVTEIVAATADINGGTVDGAAVGGTTPAAGTFTALTSTSGTVADSTLWDGYAISVVAELPVSPDANTIYFVTE